VKMDGTGRISLRNRMFLQAILPYGAAGRPQPQSQPQQQPRQDVGVRPVQIEAVQNSDPISKEDDVMDLPREAWEEDIDNEEEDETDVGIRASTRTKRKPDHYVPGTWGIIAGRSGSPWELTGSHPQVLGSMEWTPWMSALGLEPSSRHVFPAKARTLADQQNGLGNSSVKRTKQLHCSLMKDFFVASDRSCL
jgi:hypothetical protein